VEGEQALNAKITVMYPTIDASRNHVKKLLVRQN